MEELFNNLDLSSVLFGIGFAYICNLICSIEQLVLEKSRKARYEANHIMPKRGDKRKQTEYSSPQGNGETRQV